MTSTLKRFAGQTFIYGLSTILARLLNFLLTPLYVYKFPAHVYGLLTAMYSWAAILSATLAFGMETTFFRYLQKKEGQESAVYSNTLTVILFVSFLFLLITVPNAEPIGAWISDGRIDPDRTLYVRYFAFILVADALCVIPFSSLRAKGKAIRFGVIRLINISVAISLNLLFIVVIPWVISRNAPGAAWLESWLRPDWLGYVFLSNLIASMVTFLILLPELLRIRIRVDRALLIEMFSYSFPILVANLSYIINENLDKVFLTKLLNGQEGETNVGIYGAASRIAVFLSIFVQAFRLGAEPFFFSHAKQANARQTYALIMHYFIIAMLIVLFGIVCNLDLLKYFIRGQGAQRDLYWSGLRIVPILLMAYVFLGIYINLSIWYKLSDQTRYGLYISLAGACLTVVLNFILIPIYGYIGSAWITLFVYGSMAAISYYLGQSNYPIPYRIRPALIYLVTTACLSWISFSILKSDLWLSNTLLIVFIAVISYIEWPNIKRFIK